MAIPRVVKAKHLGDFRVFLSFSDGLEAEVDRRDDLWGEVFQPLWDPAYFARFEVDDTRSCGRMAPTSRRSSSTRRRA